MAGANVASVKLSASDSATAYPVEVTAIAITGIEATFEDGALEITAAEYATTLTAPSVKTASIKYADDTSRELDSTELNEVGTSWDKKAKYEISAVVVTYGGYSVSYDVTVDRSQIKVTDWALQYDGEDVTSSTVVAVVYGDNVSDVTGKIAVVASYDDGSTVTVDSSKYSVVGLPTGSTFSEKGESAIVSSYTVKVEARETATWKTGTEQSISVSVSDPIDWTSGKVAGAENATGYKVGGSISASDITVSGFTTKAGFTLSTQPSVKVLTPTSFDSKYYKAGDTVTVYVSLTSGGDTYDTSFVSPALAAAASN